MQCVASSTDGRTFTKYDQNPVVKHISGGNRDPKVIWHEQTKKWVMTLFADFPAKPTKEGEKKPSRRDTIQFLTSSNLKDWTLTVEMDGFFECPHLFPLPVDGDLAKIKWILSAASSDYMVGQFDGKQFVPESPKLKGNFGGGFHAAQTFSDIPASDGRRIQIGWFQADSPGMSFNQSMTVPLELKLLTTPDGPRLARSPVKELAALRTELKKDGPTDLKPGDDPLAGVEGEALDIRLDLEPGDASEVHLNVRGVDVRCDAKNQETTIAGHKVFTPLRDGRQRMIILVDRTTLEVFASDGLAYVPLPRIAKADDKAVRLTSRSGAAKLRSIEVYEMKSMWEKCEKPPKQELP